MVSQYVDVLKLSEAGVLVWIGAVNILPKEASCTDFWADGKALTLLRP